MAEENMGGGAEAAATGSQPSPVSGQDALNAVQKMRDGMQNASVRRAGQDGSSSADKAKSESGSSSDHETKDKDGDSGSKESGDPKDKGTKDGSQSKDGGQDKLSDKGDQSGKEGLADKANPLSKGKDGKGGKDNPLKAAKDTKKNLNRAAMVGDAASKGGMFAGFFQLMQFMQMMMMGMVSAVTGAVGGIMGFFAAVGAWVAGAWGAVTGFIGSVVGGLASAVSGIFGMTATAAAVVVNVALVSTLSAVLAVAGVMIAGAANGVRDEKLITCSTAATAKLEAINGSINDEAQQLANAQRIFNGLHAMGMSNEQIAGVLGNFSVESGIDPTSVEGVFGERYQVTTPKKAAAIKDLDAWANKIIADYGNQGLSINVPAYETESGKVPGLGLGQWTGGNGKRLMDAAAGVGMNWYDMDFQVAYMMGTRSPTGAFGDGFWDEYRKQTGSASDMAMFFTHKWEGNTSMHLEERKGAAENWLAQVKTWTADKQAGDSLLAMAQKMGNVSIGKAVGNTVASCGSVGRYDNSSIANAAISYAYENSDMGRGNDGTELYRKVHDAIFGAGDIHQSCDRGVATAVRWSGSDESYPAGDTGYQLKYLKTSDKWKSVGMLPSLDIEKDLMPGDVGILDGHTFLYVSNQLVRQKYLDNDGDSVSASYNERSPGIDTSTTWYHTSGHDSRGNYEMFRLVKSDNGTTWKGIASTSASSAGEAAAK